MGLNLGDLRCWAIDRNGKLGGGVQGGCGIACRLCSSIGEVIVESMGGRLGDTE